MKNERENLMAKLGDFSMSGLTASHLYNGSGLNGGKKDELDELSEISSGLKQQEDKIANDYQDKNQEDPNSLEFRLASLRSNLNTSYQKS